MRLSEKNNTDLYFQFAIILLIAIPHIFIVFSHQNIILNWFNTDDAFYYFKTAQNIVEGHGISFDGIARTNGFHPLWLIVLLPIFTLARVDLILPLRLVIGLQAMLGLGCSLVLYRLCRDLCSRWVAFLVSLLWAFTSLVYEVVFKGGTEAGLSAFFIILLWWVAYQTSNQIANGETSLKKVVELGGIAALTLLSRLDNVFLTFVLGGWLIIRFWRPPGDNSFSPTLTLKWWLKLGIAYFTPLATTLGVYMLTNQLYFGSAMPVSGKIKRWWGTLKYTVYGKPPQDVSEFFEEFFSASGSVGPWSIIMNPIRRFSTWFTELTVGSRLLWGTILLVLIGLLVLALIRNLSFVARAFWCLNLIPLLAGCLIQIVYYKGMGHVAQKGWYWTAEMLFIIMFLAIILEVIASELRKLPSGNKLEAASVALLVAILIQPYMRLSYQVLSYSPQGEEHFYLQRARFLEENTEPGALIGMTGSGSSGYFVKDRTLVNLDGLINSPEYFIYLQNSNVDEYLESIGLDYVFGNPYILQHSNPYQWNLDGRLEEFRDFNVGERTLILFRFH